MSTPTGYVAYSHPSRYLELIGPLFERADDPTVVGLRSMSGTPTRAGSCTPGCWSRSRMS